jgi:hypothetical protein
VRASKKKTDFEIVQGKQKKITFRTQSKEECGQWVTLASALACDDEVSLHGVLLQALATQSIYSRPGDLIVDVLCSPCLAFTFGLISLQSFPLEWVRSVWEMWATTGFLPFVLRTAMFAEGLFLSDKVFATGSDYCNGLCKIFIALSEEWLDQFAVNLALHNIESSDDFFEIMFLAFGSIPPKCLYFIRILMLTSFVISPSDSHPLSTFFHFLFAVLKPYADAIRLVKVRVSVQAALDHESHKGNRTRMKLASFTRTILDSPVKFEGAGWNQQFLGLIQDFIMKNPREMKGVFDKVKVLDKKNHPIGASFYYNFWLLRRIELRRVAMAQQRGVA